MRFSAFIAVLVFSLSVEAVVRFSAPVWRPDLDLSLPCLEGGRGAPLDMPRADAYLVTRDGKSMMEDRYDTFDLWVGQTLRGRWRDPEGNLLYIARLETCPPDDAPDTTSTRCAFAARQRSRRVNPRNPAQRDEAAMAVSPVELGRAVKPRRSKRPNFTDLISYTTTNETSLVYAFRPRDPDSGAVHDWYLVVLQATPNSNMSEVRERFDKDFLDEISVPGSMARRSLESAPPALDKDAPETERLRADVRDCVVNYDEWSWTDAGDAIVVDNLDEGVRMSFVTALTNQLPRLRREFAETVPSPLSATNALAVVRIFRNREEYLAYVGVQAKWTAALWFPARRELVLYHPDGGTGTLLRTVLHESFHQYLAYAASMIDSSPWFNEGHAQLFEHSHYDWKDRLVYERDAQSAAYVHEYAADLAEMLPDFLQLDYAEFYDGTQEDIAARYRLAWSIAYFLSEGAPLLRGQPYADFRARYMEALVKTRSMQGAVQAVLGDEKSRDAFVAAWLAFWREH